MLYNGLEVYSVSMLHKFKTCRRLYHNRYNKLLVREGKSDALTFGTTIHDGIAAWYKSKSVGDACKAVEATANKFGLPQTNEEDPKHSIERARNIMLKYADHYSKTPDYLNMKMVEVPFVIEVPMDGEEPFLFAGTVDGIAEVDYQGSTFLCVAEHKTTTRMGSSYIRSFKPNDQITAYVWALSKLMEKPIIGAVINIVHILTHKTNFVRHLTTRQEWELIEWERELQAVVRDIRGAQVASGWYKNTSQCCNNYGTCQYSTLCNTPPEYIENFTKAEYLQEVPGDLTWLLKKEEEHATGE